MCNSYIDGDEILYRCVFYGRNCYQVIDQENRVVISSQAFADKHMKPSVDRAKLHHFNPSLTQKDEKDGIVGLLAKEIRLIRFEQKDSKGHSQFTYQIDVIYDPLEDNIAHSQIESSPLYKNKNSFRKLLERLSFLANEKGWVIKPYDLR